MVRDVGGGGATAFGVAPGWWVMIPQFPLVTEGYSMGCTFGAQVVERGTGGVMRSGRWPSVRGFGDGILGLRPRLVWGRAVGAWWTGGRK